MLLEGVDYVSGPTGAELYADGKRFSMRYAPYRTSLNPLTWTAKGITAAQYKDLTSHGIAVGIVFETTAARALGGYSNGVYDAKLAVEGLQTQGVPWRVIYFAVDFDANVGQRTWDPNAAALLKAYLDGAASVIGRQKVGIYGGFYVIEWALSHGYAVWGWQTYAWSGGRVSTRAHVLQYHNGVVLNGKSVDLDRSLKTDFGQLPVPTPAVVNYGLKGWPSYAQTLLGAQGYAYRIFVNAGKAPSSATAGHWGMAGWPSYTRISYATASAYALRIFHNNPTYKP